MTRKRSMIHLDTNLLIASLDPFHRAAPLWDDLFVAKESFALSAVAWTEFRSREIPERSLRSVNQLLSGGIVSFEQSHAEFAGELFFRTQTNRRNRIDSMIASTAIINDAVLATANQADFKAYQEYGLKLFPFNR
jgi:predicted nucleic acid-binding protein